MALGPEILNNPTDFRVAAGGWFLGSTTSPPDANTINPSGAGSAFHFGTQNSATNFTAGKLLRGYALVKANACRYFGLHFVHFSGANDLLTWLDLQTGTISSVSNGTGITDISRSVTDLGSGFYGLEQVGRAGTQGASHNVTFYYSTVAGNPTSAVTAGGIVLNEVSLKEMIPTAPAGMNRIGLGLGLGL